MVWRPRDGVSATMVWYSPERGALVRARLAGGTVLAWEDTSPATDSVVGFDHFEGTHVGKAEEVVGLVKDLDANRGSHSPALQEA